MQTLAGILRFDFGKFEAWLNILTVAMRSLSRFSVPELLLLLAGGYLILCSRSARDGQDA